MRLRTSRLAEGHVRSLRQPRRTRLLLANAAVELPEKDHPARRVIEECKVELRKRVIELCRAATLTEPELLADELSLMLEGARVTAQSIGTDGLAARLKRIGDALIAAHTPSSRG